MGYYYEDIWSMNPEIIKLIADISIEIQASLFNGLMLWLLVSYELRRKHQIEKPKKLGGWIYYLRIEIIFAAVLVPQWADWLPRLIDKF